VLTDKIVNEVELTIALTNEWRRLLVPSQWWPARVLPLLRRNRSNVRIWWCLLCTLRFQNALQPLLLCGDSMTCFCLLLKVCLRTCLARVFLTSPKVIRERTCYRALGRSRVREDRVLRRGHRWCDRWRVWATSRLRR